MANLSDSSSAPGERKAAASAAVLAGIAASDAACCAALGLRSASRDHTAAIELVGRISPGGPEAAKTLGRLLGVKHAAQYDLGHLSGQNLTNAQRWAGTMIEFAASVLRR